MNWSAGCEKFEIQDDATVTLAALATTIDTCACKIKQERYNHMQRWNRRMWQLIVGLAILGGAVLFYVRNRQSGGFVKRSSYKTDAVVNVDIVKTVTVDETIESLGTARARESLDITATMTEKIVHLAFEDGQSVKKGDLLAQLENSQVLAEKRQAEINQAEQEREFSRVTRLIKNQAAATKDLDEQNTKLQAAKALVEILDSKLRDRRLVAPFDGVLGLRRVSEGDLVSPGTVLTTLDDIGVIKVDFEVSEKYLAALASKLPFQARNVAYPLRIFTGKIIAVDTRVDPVTRSVTVRGGIDNRNRDLRPGMLLIINLYIDKRTSVEIPEKALLSLGEDQYVFVTDRSCKTVKRRVVTLGRRMNGKVEIVNGLKAGERIVVDGVNKLKDGSPIQVNSLVGGSDKP